MANSVTDFIFVPGWGTTSRIFDAVLQEINREACGDHRSGVSFNCWSVPGRLGGLVLSGKAPILIGWSLGVQQVLSYALKNRKKLRGIVLISGTPRLSRTDDWMGAEPEVLSQMMDQALNRRDILMSRFFALSFLPQREPDICRRLVAESDQFDAMDLAAGLHDLTQTDLRTRITKESSALKGLPILILHGKKDKVVPYEHSEYLASELNGRIRLFSEGSHMLPLTHPAEIGSAIREFTLDCF